MNEVQKPQRASSGHLPKDVVWYQTMEILTRPEETLQVAADPGLCPIIR
jgi:hypothetical protein